MNDTATPAEKLKMDFVHYDVLGRVGYVTLARAEKRNALNYEVVSELKQIFTYA